ncbi:hypothetical protein LVJ83_11390 [Uruburuella testudinis]|uniref:Uncharacterized protein n=1 Tax=Uruburuella testudinis TaxID=1282863 RepID=A0ABY4DS08_9NEIS|nr:hypothetical protein [Uruburuella testudinis]UOO81524.1 hypothetical protein LVJ83_11390 [Uruburuella testudinis]
MEGFLFLKMQMPGKKRSKIGHLARLFNAADAFPGAKYTYKSNGQDTLNHHIYSKRQQCCFQRLTRNTE